MILWPMAHKKLVSISIYLSSALLTVVLIFGVAWNAWPELADSNRPEFRLEGIAEGGFYHGRVSVAFSVKDQTTSVARVRLTVDEAPLYDKAVGQKEYFDGAVLDTSSLSEGEHRLRVSVMDSSFWKQLEERTIVFQVDRTPPQLVVTVLSDVVLQGDTLGVVIRTDEPLAALYLEREGKKYDCFPLAGRVLTYRGLYPVSPFLRAAATTITCVARDRAGNVAEDDPAFTVKYRQFQSEQIMVPQGKTGIISNAKKIQEDRDKINSALASLRSEQLWKGTFKRPTSGIDSSNYGTRRVYSDGDVASWHRGVDIANKEGTQIRAANAGIVILAEELFMYGNTVILDHGQGVVSYYFHMVKLEVKKGDAVDQAGLLGLMGTTGLSTGSHCHWEMRIHNESVNPDDWIIHSFDPTEQ
jgi:murein DD-endopeptidase MepM/ murein hydrolase activator NlpD